MSIFEDSFDSCVNRRFNNDLIFYIADGKIFEAMSILQNFDPRGLVDCKKRTLLHFAVDNNNSFIAQYLINRGCDPEAIDADGQTPLIIALNRGDAKTVSVLIDNLIKKGNFDFNSCIQLTACRWPNDLEIVQLILEKLRYGYICNEDIANKFIEYDCPLAAVVAIYNTNIELTKIMLDRGRSVDGRLTSTNETALHFAVESLDVEHVKLLVENEADIDAKDYKNSTPLSRFELDSQDSDEKLEILKTLLDKGASLTASHLTRRYNYPDDKPLSIMKRLLTFGDDRTLQILVPHIDFCEKDVYDKTPLHHLMYNDSLIDLKVLMEGKNINANAPDKSRWTPRDIAVFRKDYKKLEFLLENGANPINIHQYYDMALRTFLLAKPMPEKAKVFEILLLYGADPQLMSCSQEMREAVAFAMNESSDFAKLLIAHLVKFESCGVPINEYFRNKIQSRGHFKYYYERCKDQMEKMKLITVYESLTMHKLLCESRKRLATYARNKEFQSNYENVKQKLLCVKNEYNIFTFYMKSLIFRVDNAIIFETLKNEAAYTICRIINLPTSMINIVAHKIANYLSRCDFVNLSKI